MEKCPFCKGRLEPGVELVIHNGKTSTLNVLKCIKCGKASSHIDEYERVRREIHPTIIERIKSLFSTTVKTVDLFKGRML